ncbi:MAG: ArnT family glycosyltransferase, partial [Roseiflexaceae bacterium]
MLSSWSHTVTLDIWTWLFWLAALLTLVLRFYRFDSLQSEMYGDIEIVQTYTKSVLRGEWPWYFSLSSGPLYHYMIAPLINAIGTGYDQIKVASILTSLAIVAFVTGSVRQLFGRQMGIIALAVAGSGSWLLVFSRLGNSQIFVPLVTIASLYALLRFINGNRQGWLYAAAFIATCGLYSYPQSFVVPPVMWLTVVVLWRTGVIPTRRDVIVFTVATLIGSLPFIWMYISDPASITGNYISEKFETTDLAPSRF